MLCISCARRWKGGDGRRWCESCCVIEACREGAICVRRGCAWDWLATVVGSGKSVGDERMDKVATESVNGEVSMMRWSDCVRCTCNGCRFELCTVGSEREEVGIQRARAVVGRLLIVGRKGNDAEQGRQIDARKRAGELVRTIGAASASAEEEWRCVVGKKVVEGAEERASVVLFETKMKGGAITRHEVA